MKKVLVTYGDKNYDKSLDLLKESAMEFGGIDEAIVYRPEDHSEKYARVNSYILSKPRGAGFCIWKPSIILKTFKTLDDGDVVLYSDGGLKVIKNLDPLFDMVKDYMLFELAPVGVPAHLAKSWTKRDCFVLMNCDTEKYWNADMLNAAISVWRKTDKSIALLKEWSRYMKDPRIVTDEPNVAGKANFLEYRDHRYDQSVLTNLATKYDIKLYRDPTQWGNGVIDKYDNSPYEQLFHHHRNFKH